MPGEAGQGGAPHLGDHRVDAAQRGQGCRLVPAGDRLVEQGGEHVGGDLPAHGAERGAGLAVGVERLPVGVGVEVGEVEVVVVGVELAGGDERGDPERPTRRPQPDAGAGELDGCALGDDRPPALVASQHHVEGALALHRHHVDLAAALEELEPVVGAQGLLAHRDGAAVGGHPRGRAEQGAAREQGGGQDRGSDRRHEASSTPKSTRARARRWSARPACGPAERPLE
jgi:hypothetical protein